MYFRSDIELGSCQFSEEEEVEDGEVLSEDGDMNNEELELASILKKNHDELNLKEISILLTTHNTSNDCNDESERIVTYDQPKKVDESERVVTYDQPKKVAKSVDKKNLSDFDLKSIYCKFYFNGVCKKGFDCPYAHINRCCKPYFLQCNEYRMMYQDQVVLTNCIKSELERNNNEYANDKKKLKEFDVNTKSQVALHDDAQYFKDIECIQSSSSRMEGTESCAPNRELDMEGTERYALNRDTLIRTEQTSALQKRKYTKIESMIVKGDVVKGGRCFTSQEVLAKRLRYADKKREKNLARLERKKEEEKKKNV